MINLKEKLRKNKLTLGSWITLGHPSIAEIMSKANFDWLVVDMEHSAIALDQAQQLIQIIQLCGITSLIRVGDNDPALIKRVMDTGTSGIIVPMVNTKEDAIKAVNAVKYPPIGTRGVGLARAQGYGMEFQKYKNWIDRNSIVIVQIEHIKGVENLEDILGVKGVDAFFVGPYDLSASLGYPGEFNHPQMRVALKKIMEVSNRLGVPAGFHIVHPDIRLLQKKIKEGYKLLAFSFDALFLGNACKESLLKMKAYKERHKL